MNKKLIFIIGIVVIIFIIVFTSRNLSPAGKPPSLIKEIRVGQDICGEFPQEWVGSAINKTIVKAEKVDMMKGLYICRYYLDDTNFVTLRLNELSFETQKKGQQEFGRMISTSDSIPLNHFISSQADNLINVIILEINPNLFLAVDRSSTKAANDTEIVSFAAKVAQRIKSGQNQGLISAPTTIPTEKSVNNGVPLPQDKDIATNFLALIDQGKASEAVMMMGSKITGDDATKQAFGVQFAAMDSVKLTKIVESSKSDWTNAWHQYMVTLDVVMNPSSAGGPIPYYGFEPGQNIRFLTLIKEGSQWKVEGLSTGP